MIDVIAIGELLIDFAQKSLNEDGYPSMQALPGGAPANFLGALTKYGKETAFIGKVGNDTFGHLLIQTLKNAGIGTTGVVLDDDNFTTLAFVTFDDEGDRSFAFSRKPGADTQLHYEEIDLSQIDDARVLHFGSLSLTTSPMRETTKKVVDYAKQRGKMITFDPNLREPLWKNLEDARDEIKWGLSQADFVKISEEEVEFVFGCTPMDGARRIIEEYGVSLVLLTCGPEGAFAMNKHACGRANCPQVTPIDTTGAGDICGGSALSEILSLGVDLEKLGEEELRRIARFAVTAASLSTQKHGGIPSVPEREDVMSELD